MMKKTLLHIFHLLLISGISIAQEATFTDPRDGRIYPVVQLGESMWFGTNLAYITPTSWCADTANLQDCLHGNFYYNTQLDSLCPDGWHVSTWSDWQRALISIVRIQKIPSDSILHEISHIQSIYVRINLINDVRTLDIKPTGWIEGNAREPEKDWKRKQSANFWIIDDSDIAHTTHIHMTPKGYLKHTHDENVHDKPEKVRRFSVRCVQDR